MTLILKLKLVHAAETAILAFTFAALIMHALCCD